MYRVTVVSEEPLGNEVMFEMVVDADTVSEALMDSHHARVYGPADYQKVLVNN